MTGGRIKRVRPYSATRPFCLTYGDGVSDINIADADRRSTVAHGALVTVTAVQPPGRFGALTPAPTATTASTGFREKSNEDSDYINGGFFVVEPEGHRLHRRRRHGVGTRAAGEPGLRRPARGLPARGFWQNMDTLRDKMVLEEILGERERAMEELVTIARPIALAAARARACRAMRVLVTGADGFIGSVLTPAARGRGFEVVGLDTGFYRAGLALSTTARDRPRDPDPRHPRAVARPISKASMRSSIWPNCPTTRCASTTPKKTYRDQPSRLGRAWPKAAQGGRRLALRLRLVMQHLRRRRRRACATEDSEPASADRLRRVQDAGRARRAELAGRRRFSPTFLRNATAFGASPRMRFDIVLNNLAGLAWTTGRDHHDERRHAVAAARPCRRTSAQAIAARSQAPREAGRRRDLERRRQRQQLSGPRDRRGDRRGLPRTARSSSATMPATTAATACASTRSRRSCRASAASGTPQRGARQMRSLFEHIAHGGARRSTAPPFTRLRQLQHLLETQPDRRRTSTGGRHDLS